MMQNNDLGIDVKNLAASPYFWGFVIGFVLTQSLGAFLSLPALVIMFLLLKFTALNEQVGSGLLGIIGSVVGLIFAVFSSGFFSLVFLIALLAFSIHVKRQNDNNKSIMVDVAGGMIVVQVALLLANRGALFLGKS